MDTDDFNGLMAGLEEVRRYGRGDRGKTTTHVPVDVKAIRAKTKLPQDRFATTFHLSVATVREWEQNRRAPEGAARTLLKLIDTDHESVAKILAKAG